MRVEWFVSSCTMILLVALIRWGFRNKMQPRIRYALWLMVALRLLLPFSISSTSVSILNFLPKQAMTEIEQEKVFFKQAVTGAEQIENFSKQEGTEKNQDGESAEDMLKPSAMVQEPVQGSVWSSKPESDAEKNISENKSAEESQLLSETFLRLGMDRINRMNLGRVLHVIWLVGVVFCGVVLLAANVEYGRRLKRSRRRISEEKLNGKSQIPVYTAEIVQTPCLFGLFHPAVYVTEGVAEEETTFAFVLCHENMHYRNRDNWWVFVRNLCLCLHWYNPLVWLAAYLSRQDCELACDEKVLETLGSEVRTHYGRTLLELSTAKLSGIGSWRISTTMGGSKRQLAERLQMIMEAPAKAVWVRILLSVFMVFVSVVAFTGGTGRSFAASGQDEKDIEKEASASFEVQVQEGEEGDSAAVLVSGDEPEEVMASVFGNQSEEVTASVFGDEPEEVTASAFGNQSEETEVSASGEILEEAEGYKLKKAVVFSSGEELEEMTVHAYIEEGSDLTLDLNFDGWDDLCVPKQYSRSGNVLYECTVWNPKMQQYEQSVMIYNVDTDEKNEWIISRVKEENGELSTTYYRYDENNQLHMIRYVEENQLPDAVFERLDLTYVEDGGMYTLPAVVDETDSYQTLIAMAKLALEELYQWTGEKVDTVCFQVTDMGGVIFGMSAEDILHSRDFYSRYFGADTKYNLSNYEKSISSMYVVSQQSAWYSPVQWRIVPEQIDKMTDEEIIIWYVEHIPLVGDDMEEINVASAAGTWDASGAKTCTVKSVLKRYEDIWTIQTQSGVWFEVGYNKALREVNSVTGPYPELPVH